MCEANIQCMFNFDNLIFGEQAAVAVIWMLSDTNHLKWTNVYY